MLASDTKGWRTIGASVAGVSHTRVGADCQDAHRFRDLDGDAWIVAVADGAGSARLAALGATLATEAACASILGPIETDPATVARSCIQAARAALLATAAESAFPVRDLACTLLVAIVTTNQVGVAQVGDGSVVARLPDGRLRPVTVPGHEEFVNVTTFLTCDDYEEKLQVQSVSEPVHGLALLTDGLQNLALRMPAGEPHAAFFLALTDEWARELKTSPITI